MIELHIYLAPHDGREKDLAFPLIFVVLIEGNKTMNGTLEGGEL